MRAESTRGMWAPVAGRRLFALLLAALLACGVVIPTRALAEESHALPPAADTLGPTVTFEEASPLERWAAPLRLMAQSDADRQESAADRIKEGVESLSAVIDISSYGLTGSEAGTLFMDVWYEYPELFYVYRATITTGEGDASDQAISVRPSYKYSTSRIAEMKTAYEAALKRATSWVPSNAGMLEKVKMVHDYICLLNTYDYASLAGDWVYADYWDAHNAYGALVKGLCVCEGYAVGYKAAMNELGLTSDCQVVLGWGNGGGHAWNAVKVDGAWYQLDTTWDDDDRLVPSTSYYMKSALRNHDNGGINEVPEGSGATGLFKDAVSYDSTIYDDTTDWPSYVFAVPYDELDKDLSKAIVSLDEGKATAYRSGGTIDVSVPVSLEVEGFACELSQGIDYKVECTGYRTTDEVGTYSVDLAIKGIGDFSGKVERTISVVLKRQVDVNFLLDDNKRGDQSNGEYGTFNISFERNGEVLLSKEGVRDFVSSMPIGSTWSITNIQPDPGCTFGGVVSVDGVAGDVRTGIVGDDEGRMEIILKFDMKDAHTVTFETGEGIDYVTFNDRPVRSVALGAGATKRFVAHSEGRQCSAAWSIVSDDPQGATIDSNGNLTMGTGDVVVRADPAPRRIDVNFLLDGQHYGDQSGWWEWDESTGWLISHENVYGTFDIEVSKDGEVLDSASRVTDYLTRGERVPIGATWTISNVTPTPGHRFAGVASVNGAEGGSLSGTVTWGGGDYEIVLAFETVTDDAHAANLIAGEGVDHFLVDGEAVSSVSLAAGEQAQIIAVLKDGYVNAQWAFQGEAGGATLEAPDAFIAIAGMGAVKLTMGSCDVNVIANATATPGPGDTHALTIALSKSVQMVTVGNEAFLQDCRLELREGEVVEFNVRMHEGQVLEELYALDGADTGFTLIPVSEDVPGTYTYQFVMGKGDVTLAVRSSALPTSHELRVSADGDGVSAVRVGEDGDVYRLDYLGTLLEGDSLLIQPVVARGYELKSVEVVRGQETGCGLEDLGDGRYSFTMGNGDVDLVIFALPEQEADRWFDINFLLDGEYALDQSGFWWDFFSQVEPYGTFDLTVMDRTGRVVLAKTGIDDYCGDLPVGGTYMISNVQTQKGKSFDEAGSSPLTGFVEADGSTLEVVLKFDTVEIPPVEHVATLVAGSGIDHFEIDGQRVDEVRLAEGDTADIAAICLPGYMNTSWALLDVESGATLDFVGTDPLGQTVARLTMGHNDIVVTAEAEPAVHTLYVKAPSGAVTAIDEEGRQIKVDGSIDVARGSRITLIPGSVAGYEIARVDLTMGWETGSNLEALGNSYVFTMGDGDATAVIEYRPVELPKRTATLSLGSYAQSISVADNTIMTSATKVTLREGESTKFIAIPKDGMAITGWQATTAAGRAAGWKVEKIEGVSNAWTLTAGTANVTLKPLGRSTRHTLRITKTTGIKSVTIDGKAASSFMATEGNMVKLDVTMQPNYIFAGWEVVKGADTGFEWKRLTHVSDGTTGDVLPAGVMESRIGFVIGMDNVTLKATAVKAPGGKLAITKDTGISSAKTSDGKTSVSYVMAGSQLQITALVKSGYDFAGWKVVKGDVAIADPSSQTTTITMGSADATVRATVKVRHMLRLTKGTGVSSIKVNGVSKTSVILSEDAKVEISVVMKKGYALKDLSSTLGSGFQLDSIPGTENAFTFVMGGQNVTLKAVGAKVGTVK